MRKVAAAARAGAYSGPDYNNIRGDLLQAAVRRIKFRFKAFFDFGRTVTGFVLMCGSWTDPQGRPLLNFCLANPKGIHFLKVVDTSGETKDGAYIYGLLKEVIEEVGAQHIVCVIMDGASANDTGRSRIKTK